MVYSDILLNYALLVCTWRHGGHVGGQEQKHLSPLGTKRHFHVNYWEKNLLYWPPTWPPCHVVANRIFFTMRSGAMQPHRAFFFCASTWPPWRHMKTISGNETLCTSMVYLIIIKGYFQMFLQVETWKARPKTSFSGFEYLGLHLKTLHSPSSEVLSKKVTASSPSRISVLPVPRGGGMRQGRQLPSSVLEAVFVSPINGRWGWNVNW